MINMLKVEFIKERRAANSKLRFVVPIIFVIFNILMVALIGESPSGRSYIMATSFNWYPIMILPIVLSLLVLNILSKEKDEHIRFQKCLNLNLEKIFIAKNVIVILELFIILLISSFVIYFVGVGIFHDEISVKILIMATFCLFVGSLPIIGICFLLYKILNKSILLILMNFLLTFLAAIIAPTANWKIFPWAYSLRILSPVILVHPNGTFLESTSSLINMNTTYFGLALSLVVYLLLSILTLLIERRKTHV